MYDQLEDNIHHRFFMENIFTSLKFCRAAVNTDAKVLALGAARVNGRGIPPLVFQMKETNLSKKKDALGTLKVEVINDDSTSNNSLAMPAHDTKLAYFVTNCVDKVA